MKKKGLGSGSNDVNRQREYSRKIFYSLATMLLVAMLIILTMESDTFSKNEGTPNRVIVIVEDRLAIALLASIKQYTSDLEQEGYQVKIKDDISADTKPSVIRAFLQKEHEENPLVGAVLVGNIPAILFNEEKNRGNPYLHDFLSDLYYMDLDGIWEDYDQDGVYDNHRNYSRDIKGRIYNKFNTLYGVKNKMLLPEIWVSRFRTDTLPSLGDEIVLLKNYFAKNHSYRRGDMVLPPRRAFVVAAGIDVIKSGWGARPERIYSDVTVALCQKDSSALLKAFLGSPDGYEWGIINVFSGPRIHHFDYFEGGGFDPSWWETNKGKELINKYSDEVHKQGDLTWVDVGTIKPKVLFYHLLTSEVGRHDYKDYLAGVYIFGGWGLAAVAGTQHSGAIGAPVFYEEMANGRTIGEAWKNSLVWSLQNDGKEIFVYWCSGKDIWEEGDDPYKAVLIGDGTLRLPVSKNDQVESQSHTLSQ